MMVVFFVVFFLTAERQGSYIRCGAVDGALVLINEVHS